MLNEEYKALKRDYGLCVKCFKKGKYVHADKVVKIDSEKSNELNNLISLCDDCLRDKLEIVSPSEYFIGKKAKKSGTTNNV